MFKIEIIGNLGSDATLRDEGGRKFLTFKVAHTDKFEKSDGTKVEQTTWASCVTNEKLAEAVGRFLTKGRKVFVRGRASLQVYSSRIDRCMKAGVSVNVDELELLSSQGDAIPRELIEPTTGNVLSILKAFYVEPSLFEAAGKPVGLIDKAGFSYRLDANGFVFPIADTEQGQQQEG